MLKQPENLLSWLKDNLFDSIPTAIGILDRDCNIVHANQSFEKVFGTWQGRKCYEVYRNQNVKCDDCNSDIAFELGQPISREEVNYQQDGKLTRYIKHSIPINIDAGRVDYLLEMYTDITESEQIRREYQLLFDQVPCAVLIIDRDYRIVKTNRRAQNMLGDLVGRHCYKGLKGFDEKCIECTARKTFEDGRLHTGHHAWKTKAGETFHQHVITVPLRMANGSFDTVMEMAVDVTETMKLQDGLQFAHSFLETMVSTSLDGIVAVDNEGNVTICNPAARAFFSIRPDEKLEREELGSILPEGFLDQMVTSRENLYLPDTSIIDAAGLPNPVRLVGRQLNVEGRHLGAAITIEDLSAIKKLEEEKIEAERLGAVGQTVAGLAHGVKNLGTALKGGMYMLASGLEKGELERIQKGMATLDRNTQRLETFVKAFLNYAKGRKLNPQLSDPVEVAKEVYEMYMQKAEKYGIQLGLEVSGNIAKAVLDYDSLHECLANLTSNALDACRDEENPGSRVRMRIYEKQKIIYYEVTADGCGMNEEVKKKVFATFFTTKGLSGTGLGLLMTRKIIQEHGGRIRLESQPGKGTTFRILLPRKHLPQLVTTGADAPA